MLSGYAHLNADNLEYAYTFSLPNLIMTWMLYLIKFNLLKGCKNVVWNNLKLDKVTPTDMCIHLCYYIE